MSVDNVILPYCIYHSVNPTDKTCLAYLSPPVKTIDEKGRHVFACGPSPSSIGRWKLHGIFYAVRPTLRPIPVGMALMCAQKANYFPYDTVRTDTVYDPYTLDSQCVYFITYTQATPGTVPLYLHQQGAHSFPSFDKEPPYANEQMWEAGDAGHLPACYVMTEATVGKLDPNPVPPDGKGAHVRFTCLNGRWVPAKAVPHDAWNNTTGKDMDLETCLVRCNMVDQSVGGKDTSLSVLDAIQSDVDHEEVIPVLAEDIRNSTPRVIGIVMALLVLGLFFTGYILWLRKRKAGSVMTERRAHYL